MILETTQDLYIAFLDGIKKEYTGTVTPSVFNRVINDWGQFQWLKDNVSMAEGIELTQKQIDDLQVLRVVTDGVTYCGDTTYNSIAPLGSNANTFPIPDLRFMSGSVDGYNIELDAYPYGTDEFPRYYRLLNVMFRIQYVNNECDLEGISEWLDAKILRSDRKTQVLGSPYRKPKDSRLMYDIINRHIHLYTGTDSYGVAMNLEYLRWPINIFFDELNSNDEETADYIPGNGSINCEFPPVVRKEIVELAVRMYLERVRDPRYQSYLNEVAINKNSNI